MMRSLLLTIIFSSASLFCQAQDSLATVHFYRLFGAGFAVYFDLYHDSTLVGKMSVGEVLTVSCKPGLNRFSGKTESERSVILDVKAGQTYFVECSIVLGAVVGTPSFRQVSREEAGKDLSKLGAHVAAALLKDDTMVDFNPHDTTRALNNLFERKRIVGKSCAVAFGIMGVFACLEIATRGPETPNLLLIAFSAVMMKTGVSTTLRYNNQKLQVVLNDYQKGKPLPQDIKSKLKRKDFK